MCGNQTNTGPMNTISIRIDVPADLHRRFRAIVAAEGGTVKREVVSAINEYVSRRDAGSESKDA